MANAAVLADHVAGRNGTTTAADGSAAAASTLRSAQAHRRNRLRRTLHFIIAALLTVLGLELTFYLVLAPRLRITTIQVASDLALSDAEVLAMAGLTGNELFFSVDTATIGARLEQHPLVRAAAIQLRFPDALFLTVTARQPLAVVLTATSTGAVVPALVDESGFVYRAGLPAGEPAPDLPLVSGLPPELVQVGAHLPAGVALLLQDLDDLRTTRPALVALISELELVPTGDAGAHRTADGSAADGSAADGPAPDGPVPDGPAADASAWAAGFDTVLYPIGYTTPLRLGPRLVAHDLAEAFVLLELWRTRAASHELPSLRELDLRAGPPVAVTDQPGAVAGQPVAATGQPVAATGTPAAGGGA